MACVCVFRSDHEATCQGERCLQFRSSRPARSAAGTMNCPLSAPQRGLQGSRAASTFSCCRRLAAARRRQGACLLGAAPLPSHCCCVSSHWTLLVGSHCWSTGHAMRDGPAACRAGGATASTTAVPTGSKTPGTPPCRILARSAPRSGASRGRPGARLLRGRAVASIR